MISLRLQVSRWITLCVEYLRRRYLCQPLVGLLCLYWYFVSIDGGVYSFQLENGISAGLVGGRKIGQPILAPEF
jgi:hypothetical protein